MGEDDVEGEQTSVQEGEPEAERAAAQPHVGEQVNAGDRCGGSEPVPSGTRPQGGQGDDREELDRYHGGQRQSRDRQIEARVHQRQHTAHRGYRAPSFGIDEVPSTARAPPGRVHGRSRHDPQPGHPERGDTCEQSTAKAGPR